DWDGNVSASDALWALKSAGALAVLSADEKARADVNNDGFVDASDALLILKYAAGLIAGF
ncbi:MAG: dockerin type I domain-containing protein, partial [Lachnospiraceae bacterium]